MPRIDWDNDEDFGTYDLGVSMSTNDADEYAELLEEFEKMLYDEDNNYIDLSSEQKSEDNTPQKFCRHEWVGSGYSPLTDEQWFNCDKCGMKKEDFDRK
jgi:hypothetical protein